MPYATAKDGTRLYYKDWGKGRTVVMIHGWPLSADSFDDMAVEFADSGCDLRVIVPDRRGFGRSDQPWQGYDYGTFADDIAAVVLDAGVNEPVVLIGFSMGGGEVARFISRHGAAQVSHAVLIGSVVPFLLQTDDNPNGVPHVEFEKIVGGIRKDRAEFFRNFFPGFFGQGKVSQAVIDDAWRQAMMAGLWPTTQCVWAFGETDFRPDLNNFTMPTLVVHGAEDDIVPIDLTARVVAQTVPGAQLIEYPNGHHGLLASHKAILANNILEFLGCGARQPAESRASELAD